MSMKLYLSILLFLSNTLLADDQPLQLDAMIVTGSSIRQKTQSKLIPVTTITSEQIKQTGVRNINDLLKYLVEVDFVDTGSHSNLTGSTGESFIQLRGLQATNTLVLLNGHRLPSNTRQEDDGDASSVDINLIPLSSIERIEILKNSGSAIYGSDAIAGVVNFISKRDYHGANLFGNYGISSEADGKEKQIGLSAGLGDIAEDGYNGFFSFEYLKREPIYRADRSLTKTVDFRRFGGLDLRSSSAPQGNIVSGINEGTTIRPCPPENLNGTVCRYNYNDTPSTLLIGTERWNIYASGELRLNETTHFRTQFLYSKKYTLSEKHPTPDTFTFPGGDSVRTRFLQGGNRIAERESDFYQVSADLEGVIFGQYWDISGGYGENSSETKERNFFIKEQLNDHIQGGLIDPTVTNNNQTLIDSLKVKFNHNSTTTLSYFNAKLSGEVWDNKYITIDYATGFQWRRESLNDVPDAILRSSLLAGAATFSAVSDSRHVLSGFAELNLKLMSDLDIQGAIRYDGDDSVEKVSPSIALAYTPNPRVTIRGYWGKSFLMPTFRQLLGSGSQSAIVITGDDCLLIGQNVGCSQPGFTISTSNTNLSPEEATSWNVGLILEPFSFLTATFDYWNIKKTNEIIQPTFRTALKNGLFRSKSGNILIDNGNVNLATSQVEGIDAGIDFHWSFDSRGIVTLRDSITYYTKITRKQSKSDETENLLNYASNISPWRNVVSLNWSINDWSTTLYVRTTAGFKDSFDYPTQSTPTPSGMKKVDSYTEADLIIAYTGISNLQLSAGVKNFTNETPPFSSAASFRDFGLASAPLYDDRGPYFFITGNYKFDF